MRAALFEYYFEYNINIIQKHTLVEQVKSDITNSESPYVPRQRSFIIAFF